jgi:AcrR family transcriptional regulator
MKNIVKQPWVETGYGKFSESGPYGMKVEILAKLVNKNKSSFYHHFADMEIFIECLLNYHLERTRLFVSRAKV